MQIKVVQLGQAARQVNVPDGSSVIRTALEEAGIALTGASISLNGQAAHLDAPLNANDVVLLSPKVAGGI